MTVDDYMVLKHLSFFSDKNSGLTTEEVHSFFTSNDKELATFIRERVIYGVRLPS